MCGFRWTVVFVDSTGGSCVWVSMQISLPGFMWFFDVWLYVGDSLWGVLWVFMRGFLWQLLCVGLYVTLSVWLSMDDYLSGFYGKFYVWVSLEAYLCGFEWRLTCAGFIGKLYVGISMTHYQCGFPWRVTCADSSGQSYVRRIWKIISTVSLPSFPFYH